MVKPVAGEIVVIPFPRTDSGKRRPAFVVADLPGADLILCQITSRAHYDGFSVPLDKSDCERGQVGQPCYIRATSFHAGTPHHSSVTWKGHRRKAQRSLEKSARVLHRLTTS